MPRLLAAGLALALAAAAVSLMGLAVTAYLAGCLVAGCGLTWLTGLPLTLEERAAYGAVAGAMVVTAAGFVVALAFGFGAASIGAGLLIALVVSGPGWWRAGDLWRAELAAASARWRRRSGWPLLLLLAVAWPFTLLVLGQAYDYNAAGLNVWGIGVFSDWAAHLTYAGSFAYGGNLPPQYPIDPGHRMGYPFMVDFFAASLVPLGATLTSSLVLTSGYLGLALPAVMCLAGARLVGSTAAAAIGVLVFALAGGLGFTGLISDVDRLGPAALQHLPRFYTQNEAQNLQLLNPLLAYLLPQRSVLFGLEVAMMVAALLWLAHKENAGWAAYAAVGVLTGLTPVFHVHGYGTAVALPAIWALIERRREWLAFFVPALVLGVPQVLWLVQSGATQLRWQPGWLAATNGHHDFWIWFWIKNTGVFIPLLLAGQLVRGILPAGVNLRLAPLWLWFLAPNLFVFQPWDWDNTKFFVFWYAFGAFVAGAVLVWLARRSLEGGVLASALAVLLCLSGSLDIARAFDATQNRPQFTDAGGLQVAAWVRRHTPAHAIFAAAPAHNDPIPTLGGRAVAAGYAGWLWTYGLPDWVVRLDEQQRILAGEPDALELVRRRHVTYVVIGPAEVAAGANSAYWLDHGTPVYTAGAYTVYRVR